VEYIVRFTDITVDQKGKEVNDTVVIFEGVKMSTSDAFRVIGKRLGSTDEYFVAKVFIKLFEVAWEKYIKIRYDPNKQISVSPCISCGNMECNNHCRAYWDWINTLHASRLLNNEEKG